MITKFSVTNGKPISLISEFNTIDDAFNRKNEFKGRFVFEESEVLTRLVSR
jgi:hypothetical protein